MSAAPACAPRAMLSFLRYLTYRGEVLVQVRTFLICTLATSRVLLAAYPNIKSAIRSAFKDKTPATRAGAVIAAAVLADLASKLSSSDRARVLSELRSIDLKAFRDFMEREFGLRGSAAQPAGLFPGSTLATTIFAGALYNADMFKRQGTLEEADASLIWSEVIDTLEGLSDEERSGRRLVGFFENLTS